MRAATPENEEERLEDLQSYDILDTPPEPAFEQLAAQAAEILATPIALVSFVDADRQWSKSRVGLDPQETDRDRSFCAHALDLAEPLVVPDATRDQRFADSPLVAGDEAVRSYAGAQIRSARGNSLGTVCVLDRQPRRFNDTQLAALRLLGEEAAALLELRKRMAILVRLAEDRGHAEAIVREAEQVLAATQRRRGEFLLHLTDQLHQTFVVRIGASRGVRVSCVCGWESQDTVTAGVAGALWDEHRRQQR
jgi:GAF domain-containing protein